MHWRATHFAWRSWHLPSPIYIFSEIKIMMVIMSLSIIVIIGLMMTIAIREDKFLSLVLFLFSSFFGVRKTIVCGKWNYNFCLWVFFYLFFTIIRCISHPNKYLSFTNTLAKHQQVKSLFTFLAKSIPIQFSINHVDNWILG